MGNLLTGSEIVSLGMLIEKNGRDFYNTLVNQSKNPQAIEIFKYLAGEEEKHITVFEEILNTTESYEPSESYPGEYLEYMNVLANEYVFTKAHKGEEIARKVSIDKEAVDIGIGFEKDSIIFYEGMKRVVPKSGHKALEELIVQEQKHLRQLSGLKKKL